MSDDGPTRLRAGAESGSARPDLPRPPGTCLRRFSSDKSRPFYAPSAHVKRPWLKFYPSDWHSDRRLRMCSMAARGLWIDLIGYLHEGEPYGHLSIDGASPNVEEIAALCGRPLLEIQTALTELETRKVFSRSADGTIFSRRMVRDNEKSEEGREHISKRWPTSKPNGHPIRSPNIKPNT